MASGEPLLTVHVGFRYLGSADAHMVYKHATRHSAGAPTLMHPRRYYPNLSKASGSDYLAKRVQQLRPTAHVFGHT